MYVNQNFINGINANSPQVKMRMTIDGIVYNSDDHISNASFDFVASSFIGEFPSWKAIVTLAYDVKPDYRNKDVFIEIGSVVDGVTTYIAMGYFKIDVDGQETDDITKEVTLTMFDAAYFNFKAEYVPTVTYPCTGRQIIQDVSNQAGIDLSIPFDLILDSFVFTGPLNVPTDATLREMVAHYASANLSIAYINRFGDLTFNCAFYKNNPAYELGSTHDYLSQFTHDYLSQFTHDEIFLLAIDKTIYTFDPDTYDSLKAENLYGPINSMLLSRSAEGDDETYDDVIVDDALSIATNGLYRIKIDNNYFTDNVRESVVQMLFDLASGFTYMPFDLNIFGRPDIDPGDLFNVTDTEGNTYLIPMVNISHTFNGGLMSAIDAGVVEQTLEKYTPAGIVKDLRRVSIKANKAEGEIILLAQQLTAVDSRVLQTEAKLEPEAFTISVEQITTNQYGETIDNVEKSFKFNIDGLEIASSENAFKILIDEQKIGFYDSGIETAYISNSEFNITRGRVAESLIIGVHKVEKFNNELTVFRFIGDN